MSVPSTICTDYTSVTEAQGTRITREALDMMWTRYAFAAEFCRNRDVLEVACGAGQGLGHLASTARRVVAGDYTMSLLEMARRHYGPAVPLVRLDGHQLPFASGTFDVVILFEAIYYLAQADVFLDECRRVLRAGGVVVVSTVNPQWQDFNPSPFSTRYWSAADLSRLLAAHAFAPELRGAFSATRNSLRDRMVSAIKRFAVSWHLMPKTMAGKRLLKRLFLGALVDFPAEIRDGMANYSAPAPLPEGGRAPEFKVLYAVGRLA
jgi:ubiquinone/menaquinone biosynthesis C-methylase UbiE